MRIHSSFGILALIVLAIFYAVYFIKMLVQKRQGIRTHQIGRRKEKTLHRVETLMSVATFGIVPVQLLSIGMNWTMLPNTARWIGFLLGILGDGIFLAAVLCMKDSWRAGIPEQDQTKLVTNGIYQISRNPAFVGFDFMYLGIFLMYCNLLNGLFTAFVVIMLHLQILQEERYMTMTFGQPYQIYQSKVSRYLGRKTK